MSLSLMQSDDQEQTQSISLSRNTFLRMSIGLLCSLIFCTWYLASRLQSIEDSVDTLKARFEDSMHREQRALYPFADTARWGLLPVALGETYNDPFHR